MVFVPDKHSFCDHIWSYVELFPITAHSFYLVMDNNTNKLGYINSGRYFDTTD